MDAQHKDAIERMIDQSSLSAVLESIADICHAKADHLKSAWQDEAAAKQWLRAAARLDTLATVVAPL